MSFWRGELDAVALRKLALVAFQLALVLLTAHVFRIEQSSGFPVITTLIFAGFVIHALLPKQLRLPFFLFLSFAAIHLVLGYPRNIMLIGLGLGLIMICHLPIAFWYRVTLLVLSGAVLALIRVGWIETPWPKLQTLVLPVLGAMFMFRLILYVYDLRHETKPSNIWERLSYFFLLPNVCFLLFPVVDFKTFRRTYFDKDSVEIYQKGVLWIFRGITHLILYRVIYHHFVIAPSDVTTLGTVVQYMLTTYLLYLRISGQFHLIIGILCLFGFNLPETHHLYYLASSFNDYWRRINIYWKDFMMKLFYYPSFMRLRKLGMTTGLVLATFVVFAGTWLLHSYQWFWLRGTFPLTATDALFWGILGGLVAVNAVRQASKGRKQVLSEKGWSFESSLKHSLKVVGMFVSITLLWTLWSSSSIGEFIDVMRVAGDGSLSSWIILVAALAGLVAVGVFIQYVSHRGIPLSLTGAAPSFRRSAVFTSVGASALLLIGTAAVSPSVDSDISGFVASVKSDQLNQLDRALQERGYYEGLLNTESFTNALWNVHQRPDNWEGVTTAGVSRETGDLMTRELIPSTQARLKQVRFTTNRWGMRDREYEQQKPPGTYRVALLGGSHVMGSGVRDHETFEAIVEERLNREHAGGAFEKYELLNFGVGAYALLQAVQVCDEKVAAFEPDAVFYFAHPREGERAINRFVHPIQEGSTIKYEFLRDLLRQAGVTPDMEHSEIERRLKPHQDEIVRWSYRLIKERADAIGARPVWVYLPLIEEDDASRAADFERFARLARTEGLKILNLDGVYANYDPSAIQLAPWDTHPNPRGHQLIADRLYSEITASEEAFGPDVLATNR